MPQQCSRHTKNLQSVDLWIEVSFDVGVVCIEQVVSHILVIRAASDGWWSSEGFFNWIEERSVSLTLFMVNLLDLIYNSMLNR